MINPKIIVKPLIAVGAVAISTLATYRTGKNVSRAITKPKAPHEYSHFDKCRRRVAAIDRDIRDILKNIEEAKANGSSVEYINDLNTHLEKLKADRAGYNSVVVEYRRWEQEIERLEAAHKKEDEAFYSKLNPFKSKQKA